MIDPQLVLAELNCILQSAGFIHSGRMSRFLRLIVERTVAGRGDELKEYLVGVEVFDRRPDHDPRVDPRNRRRAADLEHQLRPRILFSL